MVDELLTLIGSYFDEFVNPARCQEHPNSYFYMNTTMVKWFFCFVRNRRACHFGFCFIGTLGGPGDQKEVYVDLKGSGRPASQKVLQ